MSGTGAAGREEDGTAAVPGALAGLALSMLLAALGTSIANVALPTLAQAFTASFQEVQGVVLAYLLAVTTLIVSAGRLGDRLGRGGCCWPGSSCSRRPRWPAGSRPRSGC